MNIETGTVSNLKQTEKPRKTTASAGGDKDFRSEMEDLKRSQKEPVEKNNKSAINEQFDNTAEQDDGGIIQKNETEEQKLPQVDKNTQNLTSTIEEINNSIHQTEDFDGNILNQQPKQPDINKNKEFDNQLLNNDMNMQNVKTDKMPELKADISFAQNNSEAFSSFFKNSELQETGDEIKEDSSILSTMAENIAMVNKALTEKTASVKKTGQVGEVIDKTINASTLNMTRTDVQFFINLTAGETTDINEITKAQETSKNGAVSETLANLLADSMKTGKPFRINFDNDISVIIKLSKEGRISASFIPGSDAADNYLRNNLSNLVQRFEDENLPYDDLSRQRQRRDNEQEQNKKDNNNE